MLLYAQGQTPNAAELAQKKVVSIIGGDKAKTQTYCQVLASASATVSGPSFSSELYSEPIQKVSPECGEITALTTRNRRNGRRRFRCVDAKGGLINDDMTIIEISDERSRALLKNREGTSDQRKAVELDEVLLGILHRLDDGTSERKVAYDHLLAIENEMKRRGSRGGFAAIWSRFVSVL